MNGFGVLDYYSFHSFYLVVQGRRVLIWKDQTRWHLRCLRNELGKRSLAVESWRCASSTAFYELLSMALYLLRAS